MNTFFQKQILDASQAIPTTNYYSNYPQNPSALNAYEVSLTQIQSLQVDV